MIASSSTSERRGLGSGGATASAQTIRRLHAAAALLPVLTLLVAGYLLFTDPSDASYECPGSTYTLLGAPAVGPAQVGFFDAGTACRAAAPDRVRAASTTMLAGLSLVLVVAAMSAVAGRRERR